MSADLLLRLSETVRSALDHTESCSVHAASDAPAASRKSNDSSNVGLVVLPTTAVLRRVAAPTASVT